MPDYSKFTAVILAGGKNKRFLGYDKAFVRVYGIPIIELVLDALKALFREVVIVTNSPWNYDDFKNVKIVCDTIAEAGPLGGLYAGMKSAEGETLFLVSCDMPFLSRRLIINQIEKYSQTGAEVIIPFHKGFSEPMHSIISKTLFDSLEHHFMKTTDRKLVSFLMQQNYKTWEPELMPGEENAFANINSYFQLENTGIKGYIGILGFGQEVPGLNLRFAGETGHLLSAEGWGVCVGNAGGTFMEVSRGALAAGGIAKLVFTDDDLTGKIEKWPITEKMPDVKQKHLRIVEIISGAIVLGGGESTERLINLIILAGKPVVIIEGTGGITVNKIPGAVVKNSPREAVEYLNRLN